MDRKQYDEASKAELIELVEKLTQELNKALAEVVRLRTPNAKADS